MIERPIARALPVLEIAPPAATAQPRRAPAPADGRLAEYRLDDQALPRFHVWTLGCQMNRSDSEEMAGRLLAAGLAEADDFERADLILINTCAIREQAEQKVIGRQGYLAALKARRPGTRVVMTGCSVRESNRGTLTRRYPAVDLFLRPDEEPELVDRLGLAGAQNGIGATAATTTAAITMAATTSAAATTAAATTIVHGGAVGVADHLPATRAATVAGGLIRRESRTHAWLPIIYGCDKTCTYCIVPFSRGPERSRPFDEIVGEARRLAEAGYLEVALLGQNVNSYGHDLAAEPRFAHIATERWSGRRLDLRARPDLAELLHAIDAIRPQIPRLRFVTSHPWDLSDRLIEAMATCDSVCEHLHLPIQSGDDAVLRRMGRQYSVEHYLERLARIREAVPGIAISTDVIVGFCGETEAQFEATLAVLERVQYDQVFAAAFSPRPGTPAERLPDDVPPAEKRRRLNALLAFQEGIGLRRNERWLGLTAQVLADAIVPPRDHGYDDEGAAGATAAPSAPPDGQVHLSGRTREHKLVHFFGPAALLGTLVDV
ncbi:MAG: MiaB/RimO family radical SAM methylthiotransferase, partial [Chloroflexi bacterium]|nr:MiaB/RimO family radical SAM methylthiotransferase [Chloroflexota bacterium]